MLGESDQNLGGTRTEEFASGALLGVRAPLRESEYAVVRPNTLVNYVEAAIDSAAKSGAEIPVPPLEIPGHGTFAIILQGGIDMGI